MKCEGCDAGKGFGSMECEGTERVQQNSKKRVVSCEVVGEVRKLDKGEYK